MSRYISRRDAAPYARGYYDMLDGSAARRTVVAHIANLYINARSHRTHKQRSLHTQSILSTTHRAILQNVLCSDSFIRIAGGLPPPLPLHPIHTYYIYDAIWSTIYLYMIFYFIYCTRAVLQQSKCSGKHHNQK